MAAVLGSVSPFEGLPQTDAERVFLVGKLVNKIPSVTPKREVGSGGGGVEG